MRKISGNKNLETVSLFFTPLFKKEKNLNGISSPLAHTGSLERGGVMSSTKKWGIFLGGGVAGEEIILQMREK